MRAEDNQLLQGLAARGVGGSIMPMLAVDAGREDTVARELGAGLPPRRIGLLWHRGRHRSAPTQAFVEIAQDVAGALSDELALTGPSEFEAA